MKKLTTIALILVMVFTLMVSGSDIRLSRNHNSSRTG